LRAIRSRILRLEARRAPQADLESWRLANLIYESRKRRAEAPEEPDDSPLERRTAGPRLSIAETLRLGRQRVNERNRRRLAGKPAE
jgi:hypothetical protein